MIDDRAEAALRKMLEHILRGELDDFYTAVQDAGEQVAETARSLAIMASGYIAVDVPSRWPTWGGPEGTREELRRHARKPGNRRRDPRIPDTRGAGRGIAADRVRGEGHEGRADPVVRHGRSPGQLLRRARNSLEVPRHDLERARRRRDCRCLTRPGHDVPVRPTKEVADIAPSGARGQTRSRAPPTTETRRRPARGGTGLTRRRRWSRRGRRGSGRGG